MNSYISSVSDEGTRKSMAPPHRVKLGPEKDGQGRRLYTFYGPSLTPPPTTPDMLPVVDLGVPVPRKGNEKMVIEEDRTDFMFIE